MKNNFSPDNNNQNRDRPKNPKPLKSISKKEKNSEKTKSKQHLKNYVEGGFDDDDFEDLYMR